MIEPWLYKKNKTMVFQSLVEWKHGFYNIAQYKTMVVNNG